MMPQSLCVLIVEDNEADAILLLRELRRGGYDVTHERVDTADAMRTALAQRPWDLIISDFSMPQFSGLLALDLVRQAALDTPFIIVSGIIGEEAAVDAMRAGAHDFVPKGRFMRLLPAITRELREAAFRTQHRAIEHRLRQSQKMEAIGQLTGGIAHDFNNLLGVVVGNLDLLLDLVKNQPGVAALAHDALNSALRGAELTKRLLAFARQQPLMAQTIDLNERLPAMITMLKRTLGENIRIVGKFASNLGLAHVDSSQLEDALLNLAINARDAMPSGGTLSIETANLRLDDRQAALQADILAGDYVTLSVTDTGIGMPPEIIEHVIEPFFTTKEPGQGTGLGLSMIYGFAKQSGGHLSIYSEVGVGTTVRLYLPKYPDDGTDVEIAADAPGPVAAIPQGGETILVVDDNGELRRVASRVLAKLGYRVSEAADGPTALALIEAGECFDLLFTDIGLPQGMNGMELAARAYQYLPTLKILFTTGYGIDRRNVGMPTDPATLLRKPYRNQDLAARVRAALDSAPDS
ncbi:MAG: two-component system, cell cycle sensor histidine kinase and response regulator CckA [Aliidongia sp.]|nr:two-component system, cell cycle sensor histidine kinase and response regulator CckA [Aliidongia sp.]